MLSAGSSCNLEILGVERVVGSLYRFLKCKAAQSGLEDLYFQGCVLAKRTFLT